MNKETNNPSLQEISMFSAPFLAAIKRSAYEGAIAALTHVQETKSINSIPQEDVKMDYSGAAEYLGVTKQTISVYKRNGVFPYHQTGRTVYFFKSEIDAALVSKKKGVSKK
jgi:excisionase family DNA binding protein